MTGDGLGTGHQKESKDPWQAWVEKQTTEVIKNMVAAHKKQARSTLDASQIAEWRTDIHAYMTKHADMMKEKYPSPAAMEANGDGLPTEVELTVRKVPLERYTGPQTVEALMAAFDENDDRRKVDDRKVDEKYPRAEWLAMLLDKGVVFRDYSDYSLFMNERWNLVGFEENGRWVSGALGMPPTDDWETFKEGYINKRIWQEQQIAAERQSDPSVFGGLFTGPDNQTYLPGRANRVYVERKGRGAFFHGAPLTEKQQWDIMLQGKHPEGYEIIYIDENGTILSEPPPPIPPPTGEERRQMEAWLKRGKSQPPETSADAASQTSEDWDIRGQDSPLEDETVSAAAQATQKRFEQAQTEALERATKSDVEIDAELEKLLTPEPTTPFDPEAWKGLSPERRKRAKQFFDQYGTEEGLRRLRASDPEAAEQFDRERNNPPGRDEPPVKDEKATPSTQ